MILRLNMYSPEEGLTEQEIEIHETTAEIIVSVAMSRSDGGVATNVTVRQSEAAERAQERDER